MASRDTQKQMTLLTKCWICKEEYSDPRILPCCHTYCARCISGRIVCYDVNKFITSFWYRNYVPPAPFREVEVSCPLCYKRFIVREDLGDLPKNSFVKHLKYMADYYSDTHCEECNVDVSKKAKKKSALVFCVECSERLCDECLGVHRRNKTLQKHEIVKISDDEEYHRSVARSIKVYCDEHKKELIRLYCFDCKIELCTMCCLEGRCSSHNRKGVNIAADELRTHMTNDVERMKETISNCDEMVEKQTKYIHEFNRKIDEVERDICARVDDMKQLIDKLKNNILSELSCLRESRINPLNRTIKQLKQSISLTESFLTYVEQMISKGTAADVVQQTIILNSRVDQLVQLEAVRKEVDNNCRRNEVITFTPTASIKMKESDVGEINVLSTTPLAVPGEGRIFVMTSVANEMFVLRSPSKQEIEVYSTSTFELERKLRVDHLSDACFGLTSCVTNNCLYISDYDNNTVSKVDLSDANNIMKWDVNGSPLGLSVNNACNVIVTCGDNRIREYATSGILVRQLGLSYLVYLPFHAMQLNTGDFVVSHWGESHNLSKVNSQGEVEVIHKNGNIFRIASLYLRRASIEEMIQHWTVERSNQLLIEPAHIVVDEKSGCILVADRGRIRLLDSHLNYVSHVNLSADVLRSDPWCLHLEQETRRLYVCEYEGKRVFVFDKVK